jgi:hypothetical protein
MAKTLALVFGIVFILVGVLGFVPNPLVGMGALFDTNLAHNLVHLVFGIILVGCALRMPSQSALWLKILGVVYLLIAVLGFVMVPNGGSLLGIVETNMADHLLHVVLGVVLLVAGFVGKGGAKPMAASMPSAPSMPPSNPPQNPPMGGTM